MLVYQVVRGEIFRGASVPDEYSELARMGDAALQYPATTAGITTRPAVTPQSADAKAQFDSDRRHVRQIPKRLCDDLDLCGHSVIQ